MYLLTEAPRANLFDEVCKARDLRDLDAASRVRLGVETALAKVTGETRIFTTLKWVRLHDNWEQEEQFCFVAPDGKRSYALTLGAEQGAVFQRQEMDRLDALLNRLKCDHEAGRVGDTPVLVS